ncbi:hypothetical protein ACOME3_001162 [Neoechinorhynchus agilis]
MLARCLRSQNSTEDTGIIPRVPNSENCYLCNKNKADASLACCGTPTCTECMEKMSAVLNIVTKHSGRFSCPCRKCSTLWCSSMAYRSSSAEVTQSVTVRNNQNRSSDLRRRKRVQKSPSSAVCYTPSTASPQYSPSCTPAHDPKVELTNFIARMRLDFSKDSYTL